VNRRRIKPRERAVPIPCDRRKSLCWGGVPAAPIVTPPRPDFLNHIQRVIAGACSSVPPAPSHILGAKEEEPITSRRTSRALLECVRFSKLLRTSTDAWRAVAEFSDWEQVAERPQPSKRIKRNASFSWKCSRSQPIGHGHTQDGSYEYEPEQNPLTRVLIKTR
jgi:hypothetical protein